MLLRNVAETSACGREPGRDAPPGGTSRSSAGIAMSQTMRAKALEAISRFGPQPLGHFIGGTPVNGQGRAFDVTEPATGDRLGQATDATAAEVDAAVAAA